MIYSFEGFKLDVERQELQKGGVIIAIEPQVFALLELLISNHERVVSKEEINEVIWNNRIVSEAALSSRIKLARKAINDDGKAQRLIGTVHKRGFRFRCTPETQSSVTTTSRNSPPLIEDATFPLKRDRPTVAVLPFELISNSTQFSEFTSAISHELILELSRLRWLYVIARGSSFQFHSSGFDIASIQKTLRADYLISGSIEIQGNRSFVTVEMSKTTDGRIVWAERYEGKSDDLMSLRQTVASKVVSSIEIRLPIEEAARTSNLATENLDAWSAYHRGLTHMYRFNKVDNEIASILFQRAISDDPYFARAHAGLSFTHFQNSFLNFVSDSEDAVDNARKYAEKSLELDPLDPFVNLTMGRSHMLRGDAEGALGWFDRSIELSPNYAFARYNRGLAHAVINNCVESEENAQSALMLSPIDPLRYAMLATRSLSHMSRENYVEASQWGEKAAVSPNSHIHIHAIAAIGHYLSNDLEKASGWAAKVNSAKPSNYKEKFLRCFPFRDQKMIRRVESAFKNLNI